MTQTNDTLRALFHKAWGQAKDSPQYDKEVWLEMQTILNDRPLPTRAPPETTGLRPSR